MIDTAVILGTITIREFRGDRMLAEWIIQRMDELDGVIWAHGPQAVLGSFEMPKWLAIA